MTVPKHIGIILDGNRRFAKRLMVKPWQGHEWGAKKFREFLEWSFDAGVSEVTAYVFSIQNFNRPTEEFDYIMKVFKEEVADLLKAENLKKLNNEGTRINFIGRTWMLPKELQELQQKIMKATSQNNKKQINFAMAYGGREEIIDAVKKIADEVKTGKLDVDKINEEMFTKELSLTSEPDVIIRTGGEKRTSNFLPWQSTYSEFIFIEKMWPEMTKDDFLECLQEYENRERRFGK
jgi:tritrans,polycis-undecaprenyl-diphosphate synthase [geranylgeranyl-diphosphate specific]